MASSGPLLELPTIFKLTIFFTTSLVVVSLGLHLTVASDVTPAPSSLMELTATVGGPVSELGATEKNLLASSGGLDGMEVPVDRYSSLAATGERRGMEVVGVREMIVVSSGLLAPAEAGTVESDESGGLAATQVESMQPSGPRGC